MNFEQIQWNKVFCRMYGFAMIEVMTLSGHLLNIGEITSLTWIGWHDFFPIPRVALHKDSVYGG